MQALYKRVQLDRLTFTQARRAMDAARDWREKATTAGNHRLQAACRAEARSSLARAAALRRRLTVLRACTGGYVLCDQWEAIKTCAAVH